MRKNLYLFVLSILVLASCVSNKRVVYLQEKNPETKYTDSFTYSRAQYRLQKGDVVHIEVFSENVLFAKRFMYLNPATQGISNIGVTTGGDVFYTVGYTIDDAGDVLLPLAGKINIEGKTLAEASLKVEEELKAFETDAHIMMRIGGLRFSLLGEFNNPGKFVVLQTNINIFEAIATGGDLKELARRDRVTLIRQYPTGTQLHYIDLLDKNIINSPFFQLQPNDIIYVEPLKRRAYGVGVNGLQTLTTALSIISTALLALNLLKR